MDEHDAAVLSRTERLDALHSSGLLRHDMQGRLDLLCETAASILRAPLARVNVLDGDMQTSIGKWPPDNDRFTPAKDAACREVIVSRQPLVVPNTLLHPTMCMIPFVTVVGARSYLGVPIFHEGEAIGSVCVADYVVRSWTVWDTAGLQGLARLAGLAVADDAAGDA